MLNQKKETRVNSNQSTFTPGLTLIFSLAVPAIIENVLQVFLGVADTYFVGRIGTEAIAAVGVTNLTMSLFIAFFSSG